MKGAPRSAQFDDIYFSAENGLEETKHVFLKGNNLPEAWQGYDNFTIAETGFGTGLNFFSAWKLFEETTDKTQTLDFISVEKFPLTPKEIAAALKPWEDYFEGRIENFLKHYPIRIAGFHRIKINHQITLTLIFDDVDLALPSLETSVDCWFLDGFTPAKNPQMWQDKVFEQMARLSAAGSRYATFTAAGDVRRGLEVAGFSVQKQKGFGHKRDMIAGVYQGDVKKSKKGLKRGARIAIIGGGLAGTSCAYVLKQYGYEPVLYEQGKGLANGASGNSLGLYNPRFSKLRDDLSNFFAPAYAQFIRMAKQAGDQIHYTPCGALHLMNTADKEERYKSMMRHWMWHSDHIEMLNADQASAVAGVKIECDALYLPDSGSVSPEKLCAYFSQDIEVHLNSKIEDLSEIEADVVILASGAAVKNFEALSWLPIETVRGQITEVSETAETKDIQCNIHYGGYLSKPYDEKHMIGATFEKLADDLTVRQDDHDNNVKTLKENIRSLDKVDFEMISGRAGLRAATNDRFPVVGLVPNERDIYVSAAFGSHGLVGSITAAHLIADLIRGGPMSLPSETVYQLSPRRFVDRAAKKGRVLI